MKSHPAQLLIALLAAIFMLSPAHAADTNKKLKVVATLFPTYDFARQIGGDDIEVTLLLPPGVEAHGFSPTPRDMVSIHQADLFIYTGEAMEPWVTDLLEGIDNKNLKIIDTGKAADLVADPQDEHSRTEHEGHDHEHHDHEGDGDPHIWLNPLIAREMAHIIGAALAGSDTEHAALFQRNTDNYMNKLNRLDKNISHQLSHCRLATIISGGHFAFGHFARRYGLQAVSAFHGTSPDAKPSPRAIAELITTMKKTGSRVIFHEELLDPKVARIIAEETGAELILLHGAHNISRREQQAGATYLSIMEDNLKNLQKGLQCQ